MRDFLATVAALRDRHQLSPEGVACLAALRRRRSWPWPFYHLVGAVVECELFDCDWYPVKLTTGFGAGCVSEAKCCLLAVHLSGAAQDAARCSDAG